MTCKAHFTALFVGAWLTGALLTMAGAAEARVTDDYTAFRAEAPRSILVLPALNNTAFVTAPDWFLSTIAEPVAERGYYVFPANMVRGVLNDNGLSDAGLVHNTDARRLGALFGCDAVLLVNIDRWDTKYLVIAASTEVKVSYELRSCKTNAVLWQDEEAFSYSAQGNNGGGGWGALASAALSAAIQKASPDYMPLARLANASATKAHRHGLPAGPYRPADYGKDLKDYPVAKH